MTLKTHIADELKKTPVASLSGAVGVVIATLSLLLALVQYRVGSSALTQPAATSTPQATQLDLGNLFLVVAYFVATTVTAAIALRMVARTRDAIAIFGSIPLIALTNFSVILVIYLAPPRPLSAQLFFAAHDLVFYASAAIVIAFCGRAVLADIAKLSTSQKTASPDKSAGSGSEGLGILLIALLLLALWSWLVFAGQTRLTRTLLPEVTHPAEVKPPKSGV